jgi:hypothetical protein
MRWFNTTAVVALAVTGLGAAGPVGPTDPTQHATPHVRLVSYASSAEIAPGRPNSLVVEVTPARGVRVYAPGQLDYRPVSLALEPSAHVTARPAVLPKPVEHVFAATGDRSLVYDRPFRLELPLTLAKPPAGGPVPETLDLRATFEYQACDDSVCYRPTKVALRYSLRVAK